MPDASPLDPFLTQNLRVQRVAGVSLLLAHPGSGLQRLDALMRRPVGQVPPYWAHVWPGGSALAQHVLAHPDLVRRKRVMDLGAGSGLVAIAMASAGAQSVVASEIDPVGRAVIALNAALNGVTLKITGDVLKSGPPFVELIAAGDMFYAAGLAKAVLRFLNRAVEADITVLIGDIGRTDLPAHLTPLASYPVRDYGDRPGTPDRSGTVFRFD